MANRGHVGFTAQLHIDQGREVIVAWSPEPGAIYIGSYEALLDQMMEEMTESNDCWRNWYDCQREMQLVVVADEEGVE